MRIFGVTNSEKKNWEQIRVCGHGRFILNQGMLQTGVPFAIVMSLGMFLWDLLSHGGEITSIWEPIRIFVLFTLVMGYGLGETKWRKCEAEYNKTVESEPTL